MLKVLLLFVCLQVCVSERHIECLPGGKTTLVDADETIRFTSQGYPNTTLPGIYEEDTMHCYATFIAAEGYDLKISFINGYLPFGVNMEGINGTLEKSAHNFDTSYDASLEDYQQTFFASRIFSFSVNEHSMSSNMSWEGFEAIIRSYAVDRESSCTANETIDLSQFDGPVDFGTEWRSGNLTTANVCSWTITSEPNMDIKLAVKRINLRDGESLTVRDSAENERKIKTTNEILMFLNETEIKVTYARKGGDSDQYGILLHASAYEHQVNPPEHCHQETSETIVLGYWRYEYTLQYGSRYGSSEFPVVYPYENSEECMWSFSVEKNFELQVDIVRTAFELEADHFTLFALTRAGIPSQIYEINSLTPHKHFTFPNGSDPQLIFKWLTDGNIAMNGFQVDLKARDCSCYGSTSMAPKRTYLHINSSDLCQNARCVRDVMAQKNFLILFQLTKFDLPQIGDRIAISENGTDLISENGVRSGGPSELILSTVDTVFINEQRGTFVDDAHSKYSWEANFRAVPSKTLLREFVTLNDSAPAVSKFDYEIFTWSVTSQTKVRAYFPNAGPDRTVDERFAVHDGNETAPMINITEALSEDGYITSSGNELTFVNKMPMDQFVYRLFVYVEDANVTNSCNVSSPMQLDFWSTSFNIEANADEDCYLTFFSNASFEFDYEEGYEKIHLQNIDVNLGEGKTPIRIFAGPFKQNFSAEEELVAFNSSGDNDWKGGIVLSQNIITIVVPRGSNITGMASTIRDSQAELHASAPLRGHISSPLYPNPNYVRRSRKVHRVGVWSGESDVQFTVSLEADLQESGLEISHDGQTYGSYFNTTVSFEETFVAQYFEVVYAPAAVGEKGFRLNYFVDELIEETTSAPASTISSTGWDVSTGERGSSTTESHDRPTGSNSSPAESAQTTTESAEPETSPAESAQTTESAEPETSPAESAQTTTESAELNTSPPESASTATESHGPTAQQTTADIRAQSTKQNNPTSEPSTLATQSDAPVTYSPITDPPVTDAPTVDPPRDTTGSSSQLSPIKTILPGFVVLLLAFYA